MGEAVIVRLPEGKITVLNPSGTILWLSAQNGATTAELAEKLAGAYGLSDPPERDAKAFVDSLHEDALLAPYGSRDALPEDPSPASEAYEAPAVRLAEAVEALAVSCTSGYNPPTYPDCQTVFPTCLDTMS